MSSDRRPTTQDNAMAMLGGTESHPLAPNGASHPRSHRRGRWFDTSIAHAGQRPLPGSGRWPFCLRTAALYSSSRQRLSESPRRLSASLVFVDVTCV